MCERRPHQFWLLIRIHEHYILRVSMWSITDVRGYCNSLLVSISIRVANSTNTCEAISTCLAFTIWTICRYVAVPGFRVLSRCTGLNKRHSCSRIHGPLTRYVKLRVGHAPGMLGTFSPPPTSKKTASKRSQACITTRAWRTYRDACRAR